MALLSGDVHQVALASALVGHRFTGADYPNRLLFAVAGQFRGGHHNRAAPVCNDAAVVAVQRGGYHRRTQHFVDGDRVAEQRLRVQAGMPAHGHGDLGQLLGSSPVQVHVTLSDHCVEADGCEAVEFFKAVWRRVQPGMALPADAAGAHRHPARASLGGVGDNGAVDAAGVDGVQRVGEVELERPAAHGGVVHHLGIHIQVIGQVQAATADRHGSAEQAVHVLLL